MKKIFCFVFMLIACVPCFAYAADGYSRAGVYYMSESSISVKGNNLLGELSSVEKAYILNVVDSISYSYYVYVDYSDLSAFVFRCNQAGCNASLIYNSEMDAYVAVVDDSAFFGAVDVKGCMGNIDGRVYVAEKNGVDLSSIEEVLEYIRRASADMAIDVDYICRILDSLVEEIVQMRKYLYMISGGDNNSWLMQIRDRTSNIRDQLIESNTKLDQLITVASSTVIAEKLVLLSDYVDGIEGLLTSINSRLTVNVNGVTYTATELLRDLLAAQKSTNTKLDSLAGYVDGIEGLLTSINSRLTVNVNGVTYTTSELLRDLLTAQKNTNTKLDSLVGYVDGMEGGLKDILTQLTTGNAQLSTLAGYVDGMEGGLKDILTQLTTGNAQLSNLAGHVDGIEGLLTLINSRLTVNINGATYTTSELLRDLLTAQKNTNTKLDSLAGYVDGIEGLLTSINGRLTVNTDGVIYTATELLRDLLSSQKTANAKVDQLITVASSTAVIDKLTSLIGYVDGVESTLNGINSKMLVTVDGVTYTATELLRDLLAAQRAANSHLSFISGRLLTSIDGVPYTVAELLRDLLSAQKIGNLQGENSFVLLGNLDSKAATIIDRLDTVISQQGQNLEADLTVDVGDITISTDDTTLTKYIKMLSYGQQDMYTILSTIAGEYRDATDAEQTAMDTILNNYWVRPGSQAGKLLLPGDYLLEVQKKIIEIGYPCVMLYDSSVGGYVIRLAGNPRVADVFDYDYKGAYSGKLDLYQSGVSYYLTQGGFLLYATSSGTADLLEGGFAQLSSMAAGQVTILSRLDTIVELLSASIGDGGCEHVYKSTIEQDPACALPGLQTFTCDECGSSYSEILPSLSHDWQCTGHVADQTDESGEVVSAGYDIYTCSLCGDTYNDYDSSGAPAGESETVAGIISRVFEKIGSLTGDLIAAAIRMLDKLLSGFDELVTLFNEKSQQIAGFGGDYPAWLSGAWEIIPQDLQLAMTFCLVVFCVGVLGKRLVFTAT